MITIFFLFLSYVHAQTDTEKIQGCLTALYKDQTRFIRSSGHYAAHVDLLENSDKEACFGIRLKLSRQSIRDFQIQGSKNEEIWQINQNKKMIKVK